MAAKSKQKSATNCVCCSLISRELLTPVKQLSSVYFTSKIGQDPSCAPRVQRTQKSGSPELRTQSYQRINPEIRVPWAENTELSKNPEIRVPWAELWKDSFCHDRSRSENCFACFVHSQKFWISNFSLSGSFNLIPPYPLLPILFLCKEASAV